MNRFEGLPICRLRPRWIKDWMVCFLVSLTLAEVILLLMDVRSGYSVHDVNVDFETFIKLRYARDKRLSLEASDDRQNGYRAGYGKTCQSCSEAPPPGINNELTCQSCSQAPPIGISNEVNCRSCSEAPPPGINKRSICQSCFFTPPAVVHGPSEGWCGNRRNSLVILINSKPEHFERRQIIRNTWVKILTSGKYNMNMSYVFLLGRSLKQVIDLKVTMEYSKHRDLLVSEFYDEYNNLHMKTLTGLQLVSDTCSNAAYVLKTDDDMFINPFSLHTLISSPGLNASYLILGNCFGSGYPHRSPTSKWYASYRSFPHRYYPGFCLGAAMLMERATCERILGAGLTRPMFHVEDVYISGLLASAASVRVKQTSGFERQKVHLTSTCPWASATHSSLLEKDEDFTLLYQQMMNHSCVR